MIVIHFNSGIENQVKYGQALSDGFEVHGLRHNLTTSKTAKGDIHCIIGPWYAFNEYSGKCLYLDRACWDHPEYTCINWMNSGVKGWGWNTKNLARYHPEIRPWKDGSRLLILCDYGEDGEQKALLANPHYEKITIRRHPDNRGGASLDQDLEGHDIAFGGRSTALVTAAINGLRVMSYDKDSPIASIAGRVACINYRERGQWLKDLSWHNWTLNEISTGAAWEHLASLHNPL